jgi:peptidoglycan/LPS O-acetylase OafA/YrhL
LSSTIFSGTICLWENPLPGQETQPVSRNQSLDVLRCIAILLVLGRHYGYPGLWYKAGWSGVDLFFVLSGFLISGLLFGEYQSHGAIDVKRFWIRRAFKIYPAFYALMVFVIIDYWSMGELTRHIFSDLFFLQDYITPIAEHGWSLGVEEKFYLALPILLMVMLWGKRGDPFRLIPYVFIALFSGCLALRVHGLLHFTTWDAIDRPAHLRIDCLFTGVTLGYFQHFRKEEFARAGKFPLWLPAIALLAPLAFCDLQTPWMDTIGLGMLSIGFGLFVLWAVNRRMPEWKLLKGMAWVGRYSYSIYLWHLIVKAYLGYYESGRHLITLPLYVIACLSIGRLASYLVETPFLQLRDKLYPAQKAEAASVKSRGSNVGLLLGCVSRSKRIAELS